MAQNDFDIICLSEIWLSPDVLDSEICGNQYILFRSDRKFDLMTATRGGGMLIAVCSRLLAYSIDLSCIAQAFPTIDLLVRLRSSSFCIFTLYVPPDTAFDLYFDLFEGIVGLPYLMDDNSGLIIL